MSVLHTIFDSVKIKNLIKNLFRPNSKKAGSYTRVFTVVQIILNIIHFH